jgi:hypothetical protein
MRPFFALAFATAGCSAALPALHPTPADEQHGRAMAADLCRATASAPSGDAWRARWRSIGGVFAHVRIVDPLGFYPADGNWLLDPARNRALVRFWSRRGPVEWRYDGQHATVLLDGECVSTPGTRRLVAGLMSNFLYWFGVPFKFLDEGAHPLDVGDDRLLVTYRDVGDTPNDWFLVERYDGAGRIARLTYVSSVLSSHLRFRGDFDSYRNVDGLSIATERSFGLRSAWARALLPPVEHHYMEVETHQPLADAWFAPPLECP